MLACMVFPDMYGDVGKHIFDFYVKVPVRHRCISTSTFKIFGLIKDSVCLATSISTVCLEVLVAGIL